MSISSEQLQPVAVGSKENRVEALRLLLGYPLMQRDPEGSRFWFLRPGVDEDEAEDTCPLAVGFYAELDGLTNDDIKQFLTADEQQREIYGHYTGRIIPNQPVMYLLLPEGAHLGRVAMILPTDGKLRQRQIQTFSWSDEDLQARLNRLRQDTLARTNRMKDAALSVIPLVEWAFYKPITTAKELAQKLAEVSRRIERVIPDVYRAEPSDGYLRRLLRSFQKELLPTLKLEPENEKDYSFADIYAQTIAYGLFTARVFSYTIDERRRRDEADPARKETDFNREDAWELLPETNPFLRRLFRDVSKAVGEYDKEGTASDESPVVADELIDAISEVVSILRAAKMDAILEDFRAKMNREDIVIRFYEDFLAAYKPQMRDRRGVYYTPEPVVSYMVRSVDILLKEKFDKPLGLADPEVMILDPACGTGTFLLWIFQEIYRKFQENPELLTVGLADQSWSGYVKERLLPRIFGFELLMAPYAIAHLKLGLFLEETGYQFDSGKRLGVYLTNTLDEAAYKSESLFEEFIAEESDQASVIKRDLTIMVVIGNPPYSGHSENISAKYVSERKNGRWITRKSLTWIGQLIEDYKQVDRQPLNEKNPKWLQDDYVKFMRFGQWRIEKSQKGILAFITNHRFLTNPTFRGMRQQLIQSFDGLYFYDLHGNAKKQEEQSDGKQDANIFDIQQGVSITLAIKSGENYIFRGDLYGSRDEKYENLIKNTFKQTSWRKISPTSPYYLFKLQDDTFSEEYYEYPKITEIMPVNSVGILTARDSLTIQWTEQDIWNIINDFVSLSSEDARTKYKLGKDARDWKVEFAQNDLRKTDLERDNIKLIFYRPFDKRYTYYTGKSRGFHCMPRADVMRHMITGENLGFHLCRQISSGNWFHALATNLITDDCYVSNKTSERGYTIPLYIYLDDNDKQESTVSGQKRANFSTEFMTRVSELLDYSPSPEIVFYYIYAILYSPTYRERYAEFLSIDFPRIPLTRNDELFQEISSYGEDLVALHLMKSPNLDKLITQYESKNNPVVDSGYPKYVDGKVVINKRGDGFTGVPEIVWNFYMGGYQVCQKWLKDRKGRTLTQEDITHYQRIIVALQETVRLMQQIDEAIPGFPLP